MIINFPVKNSRRVDELIDLIEKAPSHEEYTRLVRLAVCNLLVSAKFELRRNEKELRDNEYCLDAMKEILKSVESSSEADKEMQMACNKIIKGFIKMIEKCRSFSAKNGEMLINMAPMITKYLSDNDIASMLNLNIKSVEKIKKQYEKLKDTLETSYFEYLIYTGLGETTSLFLKSIYDSGNGNLVKLKFASACDYGIQRMEG